jgi:hypothetical protein
MLTVGDDQYPLCLLDTLAVSEMVKDPARYMSNFYQWAAGAQPIILPCFSIYTFMELRRRLDLFSGFVEQFRLFPSVMVKGFKEFIDEEAASYPDPSQIDPCSIAFTPAGDAGNQLTNLPYLLDVHAAREAEWNSAGPEIVEGMVSLVENYPPSGSAYTAEEERLFVELSSFQQLALQDDGFAKAHVEAGEQVDMSAFPSLKAMSFTVFHKFYVDRDRRPSTSDAFDVVISSALPYVEAVITEAHLAEVLKKVKRRDDFLQRLDVLTLRDFRDGYPARSTSADA